jgi:phenylacetic acid degradation protein paaN
METTLQTLSDTHKELLNKVSKAIADRTFYAAFPEHPKAYPEDGAIKAQDWFNGQTGNHFNELMQIEEQDWVGDEVSPYLQELLAIKYPYFSPETLVQNAKDARMSWQNAMLDTRVSVLIDSLERIRHRFFDIAHATMHTTGQSFMMSFQASGPHANDRALEAISIAYDELKRYPPMADWEKPMGKFSVKVKKTWKPVGLGVSLVIGCSTFPVWNTVPGLYASLITGNPVIVKPHPGAILPIAIVVAEIQKSLLQHGFDTDTVQLAADTNSNPITKDLAEHPHVRIIDYTGSTSFGNFVESIPGKVAFTEKAGVNSMIIDSVKDLDAALQNMTFAASLYSGQMCTAPQNFFIPKKGIIAGGVKMTYEEVSQKFVDTLKGLVTNPKMGPGTLGAIQSINTLQRIVDSKSLPDTKLLLDSIEITNEEFPNARIATPIVLEVDAENIDAYSHELFGPIVLLVKTNDTTHSVLLAKELAREKGAITCGAYSTDKETMEYIAEQMEEVFTPVAFNLTGPIWMNQNAAFSDFHVTGGNPAGNATFTDGAYITRRFAWVGHKYGEI